MNNSNNILIQTKMKKRFMNMLLFLAIGGIATAQTVSVADVEVLPGTTASYALVINVGGGEYTGFQYEIAFPATGFSTPETGKSTVNASWAGGSINPGALTSGAGKVSVLSMSNTKLPTGDFAVGTVSFTVANDVAVGEYAVNITKFEFLSGTTRQSAPDISFKVKVTDRITLDETSTTLPVAQTGANVKVKRTIKAGVWNTICLPFAMTEAQLKAAFGNDVKLGYFDNYTVDGSNISIVFNGSGVADGLLANYPYLIKTSNDVAEFDVDNVTIDVEGEGGEAIYEAGKPKKTTYGRFIGTLKAGTTIPADYLFLKDNKFYYSTGTTEIKGFRGYFWLKDFTSASPAPTLNVTVDGQATKVEGLSFVREDGEYYDLKGQRVSNPTQKGIYIKNGKKVIVK